MAYQEITSNKTVNLTSDASTITLTYYAGNKNTSTGSFTGNATKSDITTVIPSTVLWVSKAELSQKDDTAYNIKITYTQNNTDNVRTCTLKLSNNKSKESAYTITLSQAKINTSINYNITWDYTIINNSATSIPHCVLHFQLMNFYGKSIYNNNTETGVDSQNPVGPYSTGECVTNSYTHTFDTQLPEGTYDITPHTFNVKKTAYSKEVSTTLSDGLCTFWSYGILVNENNDDFTLYVSADNKIVINNTQKTVYISLQILDKSLS